MAIPLGALAAIAQQFLFGVTGLIRRDGGCGRGSRGRQRSPPLLFGAFTTLISATLVYAACAEALDRIDEGGQPDALDAYRGIVPVLRPLAWAMMRMTVVAGLLVVTLIGIPIAIVYLIRKADHAAVDRDRGARRHLRPETQRRPGARPRAACASRSPRLVNGTVALLGPIIGVAMMFVTPASLGLINLVSSLVYVFVLPAAGITIALLFFDLRIRKELADKPPGRTTRGRSGPAQLDHG